MSKGVGNSNIESNAVKFSDAECQVLGYNSEEIANDFSLYERLIHSEDLPEVKKQLPEHLKGQTSIFDSENQIVMKSDNWRGNLDRGRFVDWGARSDRYVG